MQKRKIKSKKNGEECNDAPHAQISVKVWWKIVLGYLQKFLVAKKLQISRHGRNFMLVFSSPLGLILSGSDQQKYKGTEMDDDIVNDEDILYKDWQEAYSYL